MNTYQKLKSIWKNLGIKGQVKNFSSKSFWILETDSGKAIAHQLFPMTKSPDNVDADAFRRTDDQPIEGHKSWWKIYDFSIAEIYDEKTGVTISAITKTKVNDKEFGKVTYDETSNWGIPIKLITDVQRNKKKEITNYYLTGVGWITPRKALTLTCHGEIDNARPVFPQSGAPYIRTRRDLAIFNNIETKGIV